MVGMPIFSRFAERFGGKKILFWSLFLASIFTFLSPFAAQWSVYGMIFIQSLRGMSQGGVIPSESILVANWCPKQERGFSYTFLLCGNSVGTVLGSSLTGILCGSTYLGGWKSAYFVSGALGLSVSLMVWFFMYDNPSVHPKISQAEFQYIISNQENVLTEKRQKTPWKRLFTSVPVYALAYAYFGQIWITSYLLVVTPTFLKTILQYSVEESGLFTSLPSILAVLSALFAGYLSTLLNNNNLMSVDTVRKFWNSISCIGYSMCVLGIYFAECNRPVIIAFLMLASTCLGIGDASCWVVCNDMSPTFSASINAIACSIGYLAFLVLPLTEGYLTNNSITLVQWNKIFIISIAVVLSSGVIFAMFGSAEIQPWNDASEENLSDSKKKSKCQIQSPSSDVSNKGLALKATSTSKF